jgi:predicted lipoprotein with Yx(FWY)xxD motif
VRHPAVSAAATLAAIALVAAGCGSSASTTTSATSSTPAAAATTQSTAAGSTTAAGAIVVSTKHNKLGTVLAAGPKRLTVYMFEGDHGSTSACSGACAHVWPPVTTVAAAKAAGAAAAGDLGTITRSDGTMQVTYKGHPLYYFARDGDAGDAYGQGVVGFGSSWYVLSPKGSKIDQS